MASPDVSGYYRSVLNAIPVPVFVVDNDLVIADFNVAAGPMVSAESDLFLRRRGGDMLHCTHSYETPGGCGQSLACRDCVMRNAVIQALAGYSMVQRGTRMEFLTNGRAREARLLVTTTPFEHLGQRLVLLLLEDVSELVRLRELLPICTKCKTIRADSDYWRQVETYFKQHVDTKFRQSICPDCAQGSLSAEPTKPEADS